jgi:hypothetical protein
MEEETETARDSGCIRIQVLRNFTSWELITASKHSEKRGVRTFNAQPSEVPQTDHVSLAEL